MTGRLRRFFALEAGEYLDQLEALVDAAGPEGFAADEASRLCRALRGSARMSREEEIAELASAMEEGARAVGAAEFAWDDAIRGVFVRSLDEIRVLLREEDLPDREERVRGVLSSWRSLLPADSGQATGERAPPMAGEGELAVYAVAELGRIQEAFAGLADALESGGEVGGAAQRALDALGPLGGVAWLDRFPGLSEFIEAAEDVARRTATREPDDPTPWAGFFRDAAVAAGALAGAAEGGGENAPESVTRVAARARELLEGADRGPDVVPVEDLFFDDEGPHVVTRGAPAPDDEKEMPVEVRNFFRIEATSLVDRAERLVSALREGEPRAARELGEVFGELTRIFESFQFRDAAEAAGLLAERAGAAGDDRRIVARITAAVPDLRALVEAIEDRREVAERARQIAELVAPEAPPPEIPEPQAPEAEAPELQAPDAAAAPATARDSAVPIGELLYRGRAALDRALELSPEIDRALDAGDREIVRDRLDELFDLIAAARG